VTRTVWIRALALVAVLVLAVLAASAVLGGGSDPRPTPAGGAAPAPREQAPGERPARSRPGDPFARIDDPFAYDPDRREEFERRAAAGFAHPLYAVVPGGAVATAQRVARYRPVIEEVAGDAGHDPDTLEAMVYLESAGFPDARAGGAQDATGLTQILAETGENLLGMRVDAQRGARLTRSIARAERRGQTRRAERLRALRRRVDQRFDPRRALQAAARYLTIAKGELGGSEQLAVVSYHMGIGNLTTLQERFGGDDATPYAELYFDSSPLRHGRAYRLLASFGDDSSTYLWRVEAARDVMRRWREDPAALAVRAQRITAKNSREELLHPVEDTRRFVDPADLRRAYQDEDIVSLPANDLAGAGIRLDADMGELARRVRQPRVLYRGLRPEALALLVYVARGTEAISDRQPLIVTSTVRDQRYQRVLLRGNPEATAGYSLHTTGYAIDILRRYRSRSQAQAFQFMLDRLTALDVIAYVYEPAAIHLTVGPRAKDLLPILDRG
jgi:soluble lytic murein transglycosylase-like protein